MSENDEFPTTVNPMLRDLEGEATTDTALQLDDLMGPSTMDAMSPASVFSSSFRSSGDSSIDTSPPLPPDSTISAEDVIRESMASARGTALYTEDFASSSRRSDSFAFSFSSRGTFRRSTVSEQMLRESELFEPERELSMSELSEVLSSSAVNVKMIPMTSIKEEEQDIKVENAKSRWAQQVKLRAQNFLFNGIGGKVSPAVPQASASKGESAFLSTATREWAAQQKAILGQLQQNEGGTSILGSAPGAAKLQKWNRWMQEYFSGQAVNGERDQSGLLSLEEVVDNPKMMRYYASWLQHASDQNKLFFLCSFEEYRQFWSTLRANYSERSGVVVPVKHSSSGSTFSKEDVLMLRTYGVKIATKYLAKGAQFHIGPDIVDSEMLRSIKRDIAAGGEDALRTFDQIVTRVKRDLMENFPEFRKTDLYVEMQRTVEREVICLEDILMNHRFANFFWIFCFPHNYHREIAFWLDVEYEFKPAYRLYVSVLKTPGRRKEAKEAAARQCRNLVRYICEKYYPGDDEMSKLDRSMSGSFARLQREQDAILAKFNLIHLELYHRFLMSRAYAEFSLYPKNADDEESMDDLRRLSGLLLSYGLRAHHWPEEASREVLRKRSLEVLQTARGYEAICGVLTFDGVAPSDEAASGTATLRVVQHPLPQDPNPMGIERSVENFILPWCMDTENVVVHAPTCPPPVAFNFKMGDSASSSELYTACLVIYKPAPPLPPKYFDKVRLDAQSGARWVPYGVCLMSKFPLVDLLRERLAEAYEFIVELENKDRVAGKLISCNTPFQLDKKVLSNLSRSVSFEQRPPTQSSNSALSMSLPRLDHSVRLIFDTLDLSTVVQVFTAVLLECRVLFVSSHLSVLMRVCESIRALMFPLLWPHVYLPVLPRQMLQYLECPTPFIFGISKDVMGEATMNDLISEDVLLVDLDKGCIMQGEVPGDLPPSILHQLRENLQECLKPNIRHSDHVFAHRFPTQPFEFPDLAVRQVFSQTVEKLIGDFGYHRHVWTDEFSTKKTVFFDEASYLAASPLETREFRTSFIATQAFSEFMVSFHGFERHVATGKPGSKTISLGDLKGRS